MTEKIPTTEESQVLMGVKNFETTVPKWGEEKKLTDEDLIKIAELKSQLNKKAQPIVKNDSLDGVSPEWNDKTKKMNTMPILEAWQDDNQQNRIDKQEEPKPQNKPWYKFW